MVNKERKAELEAIAAPMYLQSLCERAGLATGGSKAQLINRLLKSEEGTGEEPETPPAEPEPAAEPGEPAAEPEP